MYDVSIHNGDDVRLIHDHRAASNAQKLVTASIMDAVNSISAFKFEINPDNIGYDQITEFGTIVKVWNSKRGRYDFIGRVLQIDPEMDDDGMMYKTVMCEDRMSFLHDSVQPYMAKRHFKGDASRSGLEEFIDLMLDAHNTQVEEYKRIRRGRVTVNPFETSENVTKGLDWETTYEAFMDKLINSFGGYLVLRDEDGVLYLDYLESVGETRETAITVGRNMSSVKREINTSEIVTRIIPLGYKYSSADDESTDERLTIASVNNGAIYVESAELVRKYGIRYGVVIFDDVTEPGNLMRKGLEYFSENGGLIVSHDVSALDLSLIDLDIDDFVLYDSYPVQNFALGIDDVLQIVKKTTDVIEPYNSSFEMGDITKKMSDIMVGAAGSLNSIRQEVSQVGERITKTEIQIVEATNELTTRITETTTVLEKEIENTSSEVKQLAGSITSQVTREEFNDLGEQVAANSSTITQTAKDIRAEVADEIAETEAKITVEANKVRSEVADDISDVNSKIEQTAQGIRTEIADEVEGLNTTISETASGIRTEVSKKADTSYVEEEFSRVDQKADAIEIEVGKKLNADDTASGLDTGTEGVKVAITKEKFVVDVPDEDGDFQLDRSGARMGTLVADEVYAANVIPVYTGPTKLYVNPNATAEEMSTGQNNPGDTFRSISDVCSLLRDKQINKGFLDVFIYPGTYYESLLLDGINAPNCPIRFSTLRYAVNGKAEIIGRISIIYSNVDVRVDNIALTYNGYSTGVYASGPAVYARFENLIISNLDTGAGTGIFTDNGARATVKECEIYDFARAVDASAASMIFSSNCKGNCRVYAVGGILSVYGTQPCDQATWAYGYDDGGYIHQHLVTVDQGSKPTAPPVPSTATYDCVSTDSYRGGWSYFTDEDDVRQGYNGQKIYGTIWFDQAAIQTALSDKAINQASLMLYMEKGVGRGVAVSVQLYGTDTAYDGRNGAPEIAAEYGTIGSANPGETNEIAIPKQAIIDLANGTIQALVLLSDDDELYKERGYSRNYAKFRGKTNSGTSTCPRLTVVYQ